MLGLATGLGTALLGAAVAAADRLPSGLTVTLQDVLTEEVYGEVWVRFRFLMPSLDPDLAEPVPFAQVADDFAVLCRDIVLPYLDEYELAPDMITITLMSEAVEFGSSRPDVRQMIETFSLRDGACAWEGL